MGARARVPVGPGGLLRVSEWQHRAPRVGARQRVRVGPGWVHIGGGARPRQRAQVCRLHRALWADRAVCAASGDLWPGRGAAVVSRRRVWLRRRGAGPCGGRWPI